MTTFIEAFGIATPFLVLIFSIIAHEVAHGFAAYLHGDNTAYAMGRLTLNPIPHIDFMGSIVVPFLAVMFTNYSFGWAKPVPYNPMNLRGRFAETWVASAGVLTNFFIAFVAFFVFKGLLASGVATEALGQLFLLIIWINVSLGLFNLVPVPPFDGMSIAQSIFPRLRFMNQSFMYNPMYMIGIIIVASSFFSIFAPSIFRLIQSLLY